MDKTEKSLARFPHLRRLPCGVYIVNPMSYRQYRTTFNRLKDRLLIGYPVPDSTEVSLVGNNTLLPDTFRLRDIDRVELYCGVANPGKSAHIAHTQDVAIACLTMLGRYPQRTDNLYTVAPAMLREIGFSSIYSPVRRRNLHLRVVPHRLDENGDIALEDRVRLAELLQAHQVS